VVAGFPSIGVKEEEKEYSKMGKVVKNFLEKEKNTAADTTPLLKDIGNVPWSKRKLDVRNV